MKKIIQLALLTVFALPFFTHAAYAEMILFVNDNCSHCQELEENLSTNDLYEKFDIQTFETSSQENQLFYVQKAQEIGYENGGVPLLIEGDTYKEGTAAIIAYLEGQTEVPSTGTTHIGSEDAENLKESLTLEKSINPINEFCPSNESCAEKPANFFTTETIGIITIIFGLTLFGTIIWRARRKR